MILIGILVHLSQEEAGGGNAGKPSLFKPDIVAPGVRGSILAQVHMLQVRHFRHHLLLGAAALLMEWGIVKGNDDYLWGPKVKAYLSTVQKQLPGFSNGHNPLTGWGALCVKI